MKWNTCFCLTELSLLSCIRKQTQQLLQFLQYSITKTIQKIIWMGNTDVKDPRNVYAFIIILFLNLGCWRLPYEILDMISDISNWIFIVKQGINRGKRFHLCICLFVFSFRKSNRRMRRCTQVSCKTLIKLLTNDVVITVRWHAC